MGFDIVCCGFKTTNNEAKYKTLIIGLKAAKKGESNDYMSLVILSLPSTRCMGHTRHVTQRWPLILKLVKELKEKIWRTRNQTNPERIKFACGCTSKPRFGL